MVNDDPLIDISKVEFAFGDHFYPPALMKWCQALKKGEETGHKF